MGGGTAECGFQDFEFLPLETRLNISVTKMKTVWDSRPAFEFF